ncbi:hypothetical protein NC315_23720 [Streptomyces sp. G2]|uniref:TY-Chap domain-containing protein n=1 Tax=Streptomyces TaxID=1883 RepID=UPI00202ECCE7|nr:hypothetical protein [Streptomyces sp. G2]MCM1948356.1 hypothetical protein [Streptomyces sp. G2]
MSKLFGLTAGSVRDILSQFLRVETPLCERDLEAVLSSLGWVVREREDEGRVLWIDASEHPELMGRAEADGERVEFSYIDLGVSGSVDEEDEEGQFELSEFASRLFSEVSGLMSGEGKERGRRITWVGVSYDVGLSREADQVSVVMELRQNVPDLAADLGNSEGGRSEVPRVSEGGSWQEAGAGFGRLAGALEDLDRVELLVGGDMVLDISRSGDILQILATGPDDPVAPVYLSPEQQSKLLEIGFSNPLGSDYIGQPNAHCFWYENWMPLDKGELVLVGGLMVAALRDVYGAAIPTMVKCAAVALSDDASRAIDAIGFMRTAG